MWPLSPTLHFRSNSGFSTPYSRDTPIDLTGYTRASDDVLLNLARRHQATQNRMLWEPFPFLVRRIPRSDSQNHNLFANPLRNNRSNEPILRRPISKKEENLPDDDDEALERAIELSKLDITKENEEESEDSTESRDQFEEDLRRACQLSAQEKSSTPPPEALLWEKIAHYGLRKRKSIVGDGNCQFSAIADQLWGQPERHNDVRQAVVQWLRENPDFSPDYSQACLTSYFDKERYGNWKGYCDAMAKEGEWGDHLTLLAAVECFGLRIWIFSSLPCNDNTDSLVCLEAKTKAIASTVYLAHLHEVHYESLEQM